MYAEYAAVRLCRGHPPAVCIRPMQWLYCTLAVTTGSGRGKVVCARLKLVFIGQITARGEWCTSVATTNSAKRMVCCGCRVPCTTQEEMEAIVASAVAAQKKWREVYFVDVICDLKSRYEAKCRCTLALSHTRTTFFTRIVAYTDTSAAAHPRAHQVSAAAR